MREPRGVKGTRGTRGTRVSSLSGLVRYGQFEKGYLQVLALVLVLLVLVPLILTLIFGSGGSNKAMKTKEGKLDTPDTVKVWISEKNKAVEVDFEEYVTCVVASEMPATFQEEALKAQSVAARTYVMAKLLKYEDYKPESHPDAPVCDTTHCQVYRDEEKLIELHDKGWEDESWTKIKKACKATAGEMLYYEGELVMQPLFFSSSGGQTENSEDVFSGAYPYLVSVSSPYEEGAKHTNEEKEFSLAEIESALAKAYGDRPTGILGSNSFKILSRTAGGRVEQMQIGQAVFKGTEVRTALELSSALFSIGYKETDGTGYIVFTSSGYGHGVGLSQYGANGMAKEGKDYKEILTHYYTGTGVY